MLKVMLLTPVVLIGCATAVLAKRSRGGRKRRSGRVRIPRSGIVARTCHERCLKDVTVEVSDVILGPESPPGLSRSRCGHDGAQVGRVETTIDARPRAPAGCLLGGAFGHGTRSRTSADRSSSRRSALLAGSSEPPRGDMRRWLRFVERPSPRRAS